MVPANSDSKPVGRSGGKKRCGLSHEPSSSSLSIFLDFAGEGTVGVQSIAFSSSSSSMLSWDEVVFELDEMREGRPNIGLLGERTGLDENESDARRSCSLAVCACGIGD